ncbi:MAG: haloacid dehalogenase-like hydrolase [Bacilli bacterium]|nr:haloacid dehalogenase-like hydrolase [Bacilli bacterium]
MINIYDFDGTIYDGDSTVDFFLFCLRKKPYLIIIFPFIFFWFILYYFSFISKTKMKEKVYYFLRFFSNIDLEIKEFWELNYKKIKKFYLGKKHNNDVIISASPYFLLKPICDKLKVKKLIASNVSKFTGKYDGVNCSGEEKVIRLNKEFNNINVNEVYSDSYSDIPIFKLGKKAYLVRKNDIVLLDNKFLKHKNNSRLDNYLFPILYIISFICTSLFFSSKYDLFLFKFLILLSILFGFLSWIVLRKFLKRKFNRKYYLFSLLFCIYLLYLEYDYSYTGIIYCCNLIKKTFGLIVDYSILKIIICFCSLLCLSFIVYYLFYNIFLFSKNELKDLSSLEKKFLLSFIIIGFLFMCFLYNRTSAFYTPIYSDGKVISYDVLYTTDSGSITITNAYANVGAGENDLRQSLFGVFSMPFYLMAKFISSFLFFIPNSYYIVMGTIQLILLGLSIIMIEKMINLKSDKVLVYFFICSTYTIIVFSFVFEQYIISLFYLILTIYIGLYDKMKVNYAYCGAVGTLITSGIIFPLVAKIRGVYSWILDLIKCFLVYMFFMVLSGQYLQIFYYNNTFKTLLRFSGKNVLFGDRLLQFLYFVRSMFLAPATKIIFFNEVHRYWLEKVNIVSFIGIVILLLCLVSFIINRRKKFAIVSFLWILFSFLILCIFGWGTKENGLILYSLYFFWAYCSLIIMLLDKIKNKRIKYVLYIIIIVFMLCSNINGLIDIIKFGIKYYSV